MNTPHAPNAPDLGNNKVDVEAYLKRHGDKDMLRFLTCGSVDDGKSTLIGRLLYDCHLLFEDQLAALTSDSTRFGTTGTGQLDLALLVDGLAAEREQGITIDVAYRFFTTEKRKFIVADTPGHEQYTRNMATGASTAEVAVLLVDARKGVITQTRRHAHIVALMGIKHVALAVNKMDLVEWRQDVFQNIVDDFKAFAEKVGLENVTCIPLSALTGENVSQREVPQNKTDHLNWYTGPTLLDYLETVDARQDLTSGPLRFPLQWVSRPDHSFRGYAGTLAKGTVKKGDKIIALPSGRSGTVDRIATMDGDLDYAQAGQAITLTLKEEIDISRGEMIVAATDRPEVADQLAAHLVWMSDQPLYPGRSYLLRMATAEVGVQVTELKHAINVNTLEKTSAKLLELNGIGLVNISLDKELPFDPYDICRETGGFILVDRISNATLACGMIDFALRRAANIHWHEMKVKREIRAANKGQKPCVLWFTGLSGAGKSTIADLVEQKLTLRGKHTMSLDGDNVRHGLNRDLGFTDEDRVENIRRVGEVSQLMSDAGLIVLVSFISPFRAERQLARSLMPEGEFLEVFVDAPVEVCESRDPKGLYKKARAGEIPNFTGINSPYEPPENPELTLNTASQSADELADVVIAELERRGLV